MSKRTKVLGILVIFFAILLMAHISLVDNPCPEAQLDADPESSPAYDPNYKACSEDNGMTWKEKVIPATFVLLFCGTIVSGFVDSRFSGKSRRV